MREDALLAKHVVGYGMLDTDSIVYFVNALKEK